MDEGAYFEKTLSAAAEWTRFADPKVLAVFVFLGLGVADLFKQAGPLIDARHDGGAAGWAATIAFFAGCALAAVTVGCASVALFPRTRGEAASASLFFFGAIAALPDAATFERAVRERTPAERESELARQTWELARIAVLKLRWAKYAYAAVIGFLAAWSVARICLSLA